MSIQVFPPPALGGGITQLTGDVLAGPGSGAQGAAVIGGELLTADPGSPANDTWWAVRTGTTPTMSVAFKVRIAGVTYDVATITL